MVYFYKLLFSQILLVELLKLIVIIELTIDRTNKYSLRRHKILKNKLKFYI